METLIESRISRKISKAKLAKNGGVEVEFEQTITLDQNGSELEMVGDSTYGGRNIAHPDLIDAFKLLSSHFAIICDLPEAREQTLHELEDTPASLEHIQVRSFSIGGTGDSEGVTLSGFKKLRGGKVLNFNTPFTKFNDESDPYEYAVELQHIIGHITNEVNDYLDGKIAPDAQGKLDFPDGSDDTASEFE